MSDLVFERSAAEAEQALSALMQRLSHDRNSGLAGEVKDGWLDIRRRGWQWHPFSLRGQIKPEGDRRSSLELLYTPHPAIAIIGVLLVLLIGVSFSVAYLVVGELFTFSSSVQQGRFLGAVFVLPLAAIGGFIWMLGRGSPGQLRYEVAQILEAGVKES